MQDDINKIRAAGGVFPGGSVKADQHLDLAGVASPFSLILCKATMERLADGKVLEIRLQEEDTLKDLLIILQRSGERILAWTQQGDSHYLWVRKISESPRHQD